MFARMTSLPIVQRRECGECNACCVSLRIQDPPEIAHARNERCPRLGDQGCTQYDARPQLCRDFTCAWLEGAGNDDARPDRSGVLFHFFGAMRVPMISATAIRPGALDKGTWAWPFMAECGYPVIITHYDGAQEAMLPIGKGEWMKIDAEEIKRALSKTHEGS
jgi:hypothetical protein